MHLGHETEVDEGELVLGLVVQAEHVARVRVRVEKADLRSGGGDWQMVRCPAPLDGPRCVPALQSSRVRAGEFPKRCPQALRCSP